MTMQSDSSRVSSRMSQSGALDNSETNQPRDGRWQRPGFVARRLSGFVSWAERRNRLSSVHGNPPIHDSRNFPWISELESNWTVIRGELARLMMQRQALASGNPPSKDHIGEDRSWTTFVLSNYFSRSGDVIAQCPETWRLVQKVPGLVSAMFSVLEPGQRLPPHHGPYNGLLRLHLGLIVPEPRAAVGIRIDGKVCHWEEGRALIFDDTFEHEARNESNSSRVVLFIDFEKPMTFPARFVNRRILRSYLFSPFVREGSGIKGWWASRLYEKTRTLRTIEAQRHQSHESPLVPPLKPARAVSRTADGQFISEQRGSQRQAARPDMSSAVNRPAGGRPVPQRFRSADEPQSGSVVRADFRSRTVRSREKIR